MGERILNVPNLVSFIRVVAVPFFWWVLLVEERVGLAAALILIVGSTDWIDGYLARRLDQVTEFGKMLDPVADRLMIASAVIGGLIAGVVPALIAWPLLAREAVMAAATVFLAVRRLPRLAVRRTGKIATFLLYGAIPSFYLGAAGIVPALFTPVAWATGATGVVLYLVVAVRYLADIRDRVSSVESPTTEQEV